MIFTCSSPLIVANVPRLSPYLGSSLYSTLTLTAAECSSSPYAKLHMETPLKPNAPPQLIIVKHAVGMLRMTCDQKRDRATSTGQTGRKPLEL